MKTTDTSEYGLESLIVAAMTRNTSVVPTERYEGHDPLALWGGGGWLLGDWRDYEREYGVDLAQLEAFLRATQPDIVGAIDLPNSSPTRQKFLARLQGETLGAVL